jgi:ankyrin repeat protein
MFLFHHSTDQSHPDANVNDINLDGMTPLHVAAKMGLSLVVWVER